MSIHQLAINGYKWQVLSALADANEFGGCRLQWIWRRESPFRRRVASKVFPGGYGSVTCVGVCLLRCKPSKWQTSIKIPSSCWIACGLWCWMRLYNAEIWNLDGVSPDVATCNLKLFKTSMYRKGSFFPKGNWWPTALLCDFHILWVGRKYFVSTHFISLWNHLGAFHSLEILLVGTRIYKTSHVQEILQFRSHVSAILAGAWPDSKLVSFVAS